MESIIHNYLDSNFTINVEENTLYSSDVKTYIKELREEVIQIFDIIEDIADDYIENWIILKEPNFNLQAYWEEVDVDWLFGSVLPIVQRVSARTLGLDLVSVRPMNGPSGQLMVDYVYGGDNVNNNNEHYQIDSDTIVQAMSGLTEYGEIRHPEPEIILNFPEELEIPNKRISTSWANSSINIQDKWGPIISGITGL